MSVKSKSSFLLSTVASAVLLAACGGGGGGGNSAVPAAKPPVAALPPADSTGTNTTPMVAIVTSVPASTYPVGSEELAAFTKLNTERAACGFGLLKQDIRLDAAAKGHTDWQILNRFDSHFQVAGTPGFTGITPQDRVTAASYAAAGTFTVHDEGETLIGTSNKVGVGAAAVLGLLNAPMHARGMISGATDIGLAVRSNLDVPGVTGARVSSWFDLAYLNITGTQEPPANTVLTYPCAGRTGIERQLLNEDPNPVPGRDLATSPLGSSVQVRVRKGQTLRLTSYTMAEQNSGLAVVVRPPVGSQYNNEPYPNTTGAFGLHETWVAADSALKANTAYTVNLGGTVDGVAFTKVFTFTTGN